MRAMTAPSAFSIHPTPIGDALIVVTDGRLALLHMLDETPGTADAAIERATRALRASLEPDAAATLPVTAQLDEYFAGDRTAFDLPLDLDTTRGFTRAALLAITEIPYAHVAAYGEVAVAAGSPRAGRAVGTACAHTPISIVVPVHRVVRADGSIGEYGGHPERKRFLLDLEARVAGTSAAE